MAEKTNRPLKQRVQRLEKHKAKSTRISHLFECLREQKESGGGIGPFPKCVGVLGITSGELFEDDTELMPWDPAPEERVFKYGVYQAKMNISILSLCHLMPDHYQAHTCNLKRPANDDMEFPKQHRYRVYLRNLLKAVSHFLMKLMGYEGCENQRCLLYRQPFQPHWHQFLCSECDVKFCESMNRNKRNFIRWYRQDASSPVTIDLGGDGRSATNVTAIPPTPSSSSFDHFFFAEKRYQELQKALKICDKKLVGLQYKYRHHTEFERELEWLHYALKLFASKNQERHDFQTKTGSYKIKRRSLERLLTRVHEEEPSIEVLHRTLEQPFLTIRCLTDMTERGPYQTPVPLDNMGYAEAYFNRRHSTGGTYLEVAGGLQPKTVGNFPKIGLNAQIMMNEKPLPFDKYEERRPPVGHVFTKR